MLDRLDQQPPDALLALIKLHDADPRADKIDLGVGVYRTGQGATPVFGAIKAAEQKLVDEQDTKAYLGPEGDMGFVHALMPYVVRQRSDARRADRRDADPGRHRRGAAGAGAGPARGRDAGADGHAELAEPRADRQGSRPGAGDLRACDRRRGRRTSRRWKRRSPPPAARTSCCCTAAATTRPGIDYTPEQWDGSPRLLADSPVLPVIDLAYQGLGEGMDEDAYGARAVIDAVPEALIALELRQEFRALPRPRRRALRAGDRRGGADAHSVERPRACPRGMVDAARPWRRRGAAGAARRRS